MSIRAMHDHCADCDWLGREAERTATEYGKDVWLSVTGGDPNRPEHSALYEKERPMITPTKYRKKPIIIEAAQWHIHGDHSEVDYWRYPPVAPSTGEIVGSGGVLMGEMKHSETPVNFRRSDCNALMKDHGFIDTLEGGHTVCPGDWIIRGVQGEFYPCKPDIFEATYEAVDPS